MATTKINVRSPYYIRKLRSGSVPDTETLSLKVWTGAKASVPGSATYSLTKSVSDAGGGFVYATFEVSELIRDYIEITFSGDYVSQCVWVNDGTTTYLATDGYGYFEEGVNPQLSKRQLISNSVIWRPRNENIIVPFYADDDYEIVMASNGSPVRTEVVSEQTNTNAMILYVSPAGDDTIFNFQQRVLDDGGVYEFNTLLERLECKVDANAVDEIRIYQVDANDMTDAPYESIKVRTMHLDKFPDRKVTFVNKFGALQDVYFFAKEVTSVTGSKEQYRSNVMNTQNLTYSGHQYRSFNVQGRESIRLNTGYISEDYNEVLKQLMLSEQVWLSIEDEVYPVTPKTSSFTFKTSLNDKLVDYSVEFDYANDLIQSMR